MLLCRYINLCLVVTNAPTTTLLTDVPVMSSKDFEEACKQPVIIASVVSMAAMLPLNFLGMFALFTKLEKIFNPHRIMANQRQKGFAHRLAKKK
jgi:hypothetical protein